MLSQESKQLNGTNRYGNITSENDVVKSLNKRHAHWNLSL